MCVSLNLNCAEFRSFSDFSASVRSKHGISWLNKLEVTQRRTDKYQAESWYTTANVSGPCLETLPLGSQKWYCYCWLHCLIRSIIPCCNTVEKYWSLGRSPNHVLSSTFQVSLLHHIYMYNLGKNHRDPRCHLPPSHQDAVWRAPLNASRVACGRLLAAQGGHQSFLVPTMAFVGAPNLVDFTITCVPVPDRNKNPLAKTLLKCIRSVRRETCKDAPKNAMGGAKMMINCNFMLFFYIYNAQTNP